MALVQLTDPSDESVAPAAALRRAAGIDLGTTNTLAACVDEHGKAAVIADDQGAKMLPSVVHYAADRIAVGQQAAGMLESDPANTIASVKRLMGRARTDIDEAFSFSFAAGTEQGMLKLATAAGDKSPVEVSADILRAIQARACEKLGGPLEGAVITVPAYFDDAQRQATKDAASLAGLKVLRLLNEPTAAALAYGLDRDEQGMYAVYDLGGGTFDVSVLRLRRGVFEVVAAAGDSALGGDDYDLALARLAAAKAKAAYQPSAVALRAARRAKEQLASANEAECALADGTKVQITRNEFEDACAALTNRTIAIMRACLKDKGIAADELDGVILVGGATRMPAIKRSLAEELGVKVIDDIDPDEAVAIGAAIQADMLIGNRRGKDWLLLDVISLSLGLETMGGLVERIIPRNSSIPIARAQEFTTHKDGQTAMSIHVVQGERDLVSDCRSLARFSLRGLPPLGAGAARILVTFQVDADGLLQVSAAEQTTGVAARIEVKPSYGLNADEIAGMLRSARENASEDSINRSLIEARNEAASIVAITRSALEQDRELAAADEPAIASAIAAVEQASAGQDADAVRQAVKQLNEAAEPFAQRRMEHAMKKALAGRDISKIT